jgi:deoxyribose-phosphate aldolase
MDVRKVGGRFMNISGYIDHTLLKQTSTADQILQLCKEAEEYRFAAVCIPPYFVQLARSILGDSLIKIATVIGFPLGTHSIGAKAIEISIALDEGADEFDVVANIAAIKSNWWCDVEKEVQLMRELTEGNILKVIIESAQLTEEEKIKVTQLVCKYGCDFVKTSTGFFGGATIEDVRLLRGICTASPQLTQVKASGGIKTYQQALDMVNAGATRIGTSSGVQIMLEEKNAGQS